MCKVDFKRTCATFKSASFFFKSESHSFKAAPKPGAGCGRAKLPRQDIAPVWSKKLVESDKLSTDVIQKTIDSCAIPLREVNVYAYVGRERGNSSNPNSPRVINVWQSQVGYYNGDDKQMRFGGMYVNGQRGSETDQAESHFFELDFADRSSFRVYANGTQYYADVWVG